MEMATSGGQRLTKRWRPLRGTMNVNEEAKFLLLSRRQSFNILQTIGSADQLTACGARVVQELFLLSGRANKFPVRVRTGRPPSQDDGSLVGVGDKNLEVCSMTGVRRNFPKASSASRYRPGIHCCCAPLPLVVLVLLRHVPRYKLTFSETSARE